MNTAELKNLRQFLNGPIGLDDSDLDVLYEELNRVGEAVLVELNRRHLLEREAEESLEDEP